MSTIKLMQKIQTEIDGLESEIVRLKAEVVDERAVVDEFRSALSTIYLINSNNPSIENICKQLLDRIKC